MERENDVTKKPMSEQMIFRNMMIAVFVVSAVFFIKNLVTKAWQGAIVVGACLAVFAMVVVIMKKLKASQNKQQLILCMGIAVLVFCISLNSGNYYSDDFPLYLAVIGLSGLYLIPRYALIQMALIDVMFLVMYFVHPEKADPFGQYIMCMCLFTVAAYTIYAVIKRGRSYIEISESRAREAERLLTELKHAGKELQNSSTAAVRRVARLEEANTSLESSASVLRESSVTIIQDSEEVSETFDVVQERMTITEAHIDALNAEVNSVENSLEENKKSMQSMVGEMQELKDTISSTTQVFSMLQEQIQEISQSAQELTKIASSTSMLALNASIEAARAGQMGAGFAVVATNIQQLANDSNNCSAQVAEIVKNMHEHIDETSLQLSGSTTAIHHSIESLNDFHKRFEELTQQFGSLYQNIEEQNTNVQEMDSIFKNLQLKIADMKESSSSSQSSVNTIADAIDIYKDNIQRVVADNRVINELSVSMLDLADTEKE